MRELKVGLIESGVPEIDARFKTTNSDLKPGDIVKITGNLTVDKVGNTAEQAIGIVEGNWDGLKDRVPVILQGFVYGDGTGLTLGTPINRCITPLERLDGQITKGDGSKSNDPMVFWVCA